MATDEHEVLENYITQHNLKITKQRRAVLEAFLRCEEHISAEELYKMVSVKEPKIGLATVYRTLALLTESGLAAELDFGDGRARYEFVREDAKNHCHAVCSACGRVFNCGEFDSGEAELKKITGKLLKKSGFEAKGYRLNFYGLCENCRRREGELK